MEHHLAQRQRLLQVLAALAHERVVRADLQAQRLDVDDLGEDLRRAVEERARQHRPLDPLLLRVGLGLEGASGLLEAEAGDVEPVLDVVEQPAGQRLDQRLLGGQRVSGRVVRLDPVTVVEDAPLSVDLPLGPCRRY